MASHARGNPFKQRLQEVDERRRGLQHKRGSPRMPMRRQIRSEIHERDDTPQAVNGCLRLVVLLL